MQLISDAEYVTSKMMGPSTIQSKLKENQLTLSSEESDTERFSGLKEILIKPKGIYRHTRILTRVIIPIEYNLLARGIEADDEHSAISKSHSSNSYVETEVFAYMANIIEEIVRKFEQQARVQQAQHKMLQA